MYLTRMVPLPLLPATMFSTNPMTGTACLQPVPALSRVFGVNDTSDMIGPTDPSMFTGPYIGCEP